MLFFRLALTHNKMKHLNKQITLFCLFNKNHITLSEGVQKQIFVTIMINAFQKLTHRLNFKIVIFIKIR
jgi:hypothetical protein